MMYNSKPAFPSAHGTHIRAHWLVERTFPAQWMQNAEDEWDSKRAKASDVPSNPLRRSELVDSWNVVIDGRIVRDSTLAQITRPSSNGHTATYTETCQVARRSKLDSPATKSHTIR